MTWHLIGPSNLITHYFGMKTVRFESEEYTFSVIAKTVVPSVLAGRNSDGRSDIRTASVPFLQSSDECQGHCTQNGRLSKVTFER